MIEWKKKNCIPRGKEDRERNVKIVKFEHFLGQVQRGGQ